MHDARATTASGEDERSGVEALLKDTAQKFGEELVVGLLSGKINGISNEQNAVHLQLASMQVMCAKLFPFFSAATTPTRNCT